MFKKYACSIFTALFISIIFTTVVPIPVSITVLAQDDAIYFEDPNLKLTIQKIIEKPVGEEITQKDAQKVTKLDLTAKNISNLEGLKYFENIGRLTLSDDNISALKTLTDLAYLYLTNNNVSDISILDQLKEFDIIEFSNNHITDISVLHNLFRFRHGIILDETIELPAQQLKEGTTVAVTNPIKDKDGIVKEIKINNDYYDEKRNTVVWENVKESQTLSYTFNKVMNIVENGDVEFSGNVFTEVTVLPNQKPVLHGIEDKQIRIGESFNPLGGVSAFDEEDGNLTNQIKIEGEVENTQEDQYELIYSVTDSTGEITTATRLITVIAQSEAINQIPIIDASDRILKVGDSFNPLAGVSAFDLEDGDLTHKIEVISNNVDITTAGTYEVTYNVMDSQGDEVTLTIIVMVREIPQTGYILPLGYGLILLVSSSIILYREKRQS